MGSDQREPFAWTIPGDDTADMNGFVPAKIRREGEFTKPLYDSPSGEREPVAWLVTWTDVAGKVDKKIVWHNTNAAAVRHQVAQLNSCDWIVKVQSTPLYGEREPIRAALTLLDEVRNGK